MGDYNEIVVLPYNDSVFIEYGCMAGSKVVLLIIVGQDGSIYGYENKYISMAEYYNKKYGVSVIVASNPYDGSDMLGLSVGLVKQRIGNDSVICCMGVSNGGRLLAQYGHIYDNIKKMLIINAPLMINWHKTKKGIEDFRGETVRFVYGSQDTSASYAELISLIENRTVSVELLIAEGADHNFKGMGKEFMMLPDFLFNQDHMTCGKEKG